jgi:hypothetical protein
VCSESLKRERVSHVIPTWAAWRAGRVLAAEWRVVRLGLVRYAGGFEEDPQTAWSSAIDRKDVKKAVTTPSR